MRRFRAIPLAALAFAVSLTACADADEAVEAASSEAAATADVGSSPPGQDDDGERYVTQITTLEGDDGEYYSTQRPEELYLQEFTSALGLEWRSWGPDTAVATGQVIGSWCASDCSDWAGAMVVLCDVVDGHFTRFGVFGDVPSVPGDQVLGSPLAFATDGPYDEADWYGCEEPDLSEFT